MASPQSRNEEILESIVNDTPYTRVPQSREEYLLLEIKDLIEQGGGGGTSNVQGLVLTMNPTTYVITAYLIDGEGQQVGESQSIDIPLESTIVGASYDNTTKIITFTLTSGATLTVPIGDIIYGLQPLIDAQHKLNASLVDDTQGRLKFMWVGTAAQYLVDGPNLPVGTPFIITDDVDIDTTPTQNSSNPITSGGVYTALQGKQDTLTFDSTPTQSSTNPVTSGGVYAALARIDPATGDVYFGATRVGRVLDQATYDAIAVKDNIYYLTYPTPAANNAKGPSNEPEEDTKEINEQLKELIEEPKEELKKGGDE